VSVETSVPTSRTRTFLVHNSVPLKFTAEDFQAAREQIVTKVILLPNDLSAAGGELVDTVVRYEKQPTSEAIQEAIKRGTIIGVVRMGCRESAVFGIPRALQQAFDPRTVDPRTYAANPDPSPSAAPPDPFGPSPSMAARDPFGADDENIVKASIAAGNVTLLRTPFAFHSLLSSETRRIAFAEESIRRQRASIEEMSKATDLPFDPARLDRMRQDLTMMQQQLLTRQQSLRLAQSELAAQLNLLELEQHSAETALKAAQESLDQVKQAVGAGIAKTQELTAAAQKKAEAEVRALQIRTLLELYQRADDNVAAENPQPTTGPK